MSCIDRPIVERFRKRRIRGSYLPYASDGTKIFKNNSILKQSRRFTEADATSLK